MGKSFYVFGGDAGPLYAKSTKVIAAFSTVTKKWKKSGEMNAVRGAHGVFAHRGQFIVIGGRNPELMNFAYSTELCSLENDSILCKNVDPKLKDYVWYPQSMRVPADYCSK